MSPRIIDDSKEYVYNLVASDSLFECVEKKESSFIDYTFSTYKFSIF